jgi:hypothetical protein
MAILTLNNKENASKLICFSTCPNIITVEQQGLSYSNSYVTLDVTRMTPIHTEEVSRIIVNGHSIVGTDDITKVNGRRFWRTYKDKFSCLSIVNALKSIPALAMNYDINFNQGNTLTIRAKNPGASYSITVEYENMDGITKSGTNGSITSSGEQVLIGTNFSRVYLDLYYNGDNYLTTLQKEFYRDSISFNVSPALQTITTYDDAVKWKGKLYAMVDDKFIDLTDTNENYVVNGYLVNQGGTYIDYGSLPSAQVYPALNVSRGGDRTQHNKTLLYIYEPTFPITLYRNGKTSETVTIKYLESDEVETSSSTQTLTLNKDKMFDTYTITLDEEKMRDSYYVDLIFSFGILRLNVINPPYSNAECNRVYWYNSYGGVSYFDFLGDKKDERKSEVTTYNKSLLDFYKNDKQEQSVVYFRENDMTVSLSTHLMDNDGLYLLYDLQNSYKAWITINGVPYYIIIQSITVEEPSTNVFTATIKYKYSLLDSFA